MTDVNYPGSGSRRRALAAAATALAAVALAAAVAGRGCGPQDDTPDGAVRAFAAAAQAGDKRAVYDLLGPQTRRTLAERAARASELGERRYEPEEMIGLGPISGETTRSFDTIREDGDRAVVGVFDGNGGRVDLDVVRVNGRWRLELAP
jgi:hypothetical protein